MTIAFTAVIALAAAASVAVAATRVLRRRPHPPASPGTGRRILFPYMAQALSTSALEAALRLARAEDGVLVPVFLVSVPMTLSLNAPLPRQSQTCVQLQERIDLDAAPAGIPVDHRIARGRTYRHALRQTLGHERYDQLVIAAAVNGAGGFGSGDVAWVIEHAAGEIIVLRPSRNDHLKSTDASRRPSRLLPAIDVTDHEASEETAEPATATPTV